MLAQDDLQHDDDHDDRDADDVGHELRVDQAQAAGGEQDALPPGRARDDIALERGGDAEDAEARRDDDLNGGEHALIHEQHGGVHRKDVRHDERRDGELRGIDAGLHGVGLGDGGAGVGRQRDRRRDIGDDAEVEHEEVGRDLRDAERDEDRRAGGGHDAVVGGRGHAHAEHDAAEHRQEERQQQRERRVRDGAADRNDAADELGRQARDGDAARDHTGHGAGHGDGDAALAAGLERVEDHAAGLFGGDAGDAAGLRLFNLGRGVTDGADQAHGDGDQDGDRGGKLQRADVRRDHPDQEHERQQQIDVADEVLEAGQLRARDALEAELLGLEMHGDEDAAEIQHGGQDRPECDLTIGHAHVLGHEERGRAHDGRHDLAAGGGRRLDGAGELRLVAGLFHHRDRDRAGGDGVADGRAGHHAAQRGRDNGDLGRAAGGPAGDGVGCVNEEAGDAGSLKEAAEDDEHGDELRAHLHGRAQHAGRAEKERVDHAAEHLLERLPGVEHTHERVHEQRADDHEDRQADAAAAQLGQHEDAGHADGDEKRRHLGGAGERLDEHGVVKAIVEKRSRADDHDDDIVPRQAVGVHMLLAGGVGHVFCIFSVILFGFVG